jgi:hypothetical protein
MKVKFANAEVDVWKLRKGIVLAQRDNFVHLESFDVKPNGTLIQVNFHNGCFGIYHPCQLEWLEPHD